MHLRLTMEPNTEALISRKPVNNTSGQNRSSSSSRAESSETPHNSTTHATVPTSVDTDPDRITLSRAALGQLVDALAASISLLQTGLVDKKYSQKAPESTGEPSAGTEQNVPTTDRETHCHRVQLLSEPVRKHRKGLLQQVFRQGR